MHSIHADAAGCATRHSWNPHSQVLSSRAACWLVGLQVQKLKVDMESAMLEMDQILKSNELSIALVAAIPALLVAGAVVALIVRWLTPRPPDPLFEALPCRCGFLQSLSGSRHALQMSLPRQ